MPIIIVYGIPSKTKLLDLEKFRNELIERTCSVKELNIKKDQVVCFFPSDLINNRLDEKIIIFVEGLFKKPERTTETLQQLSKELTKCGENFFSHIALIECFIQPFKKQNGFWFIQRTGVGFQILCYFQKKSCWFF